MVRMTTRYYEDNYTVYYSDSFVKRMGKGLASLVNNNLLVNGISLFSGVVTVMFMVI